MQRISRRIKPKVCTERLALLGLVHHGLIELFEVGALVEKSSVAHDLEEWGLYFGQGLCLVFVDGGVGGCRS